MTLSFEHTRLHYRNIQPYDCVTEYTIQRKRGAAILCHRSGPRESDNRNVVRHLYGISAEVAVSGPAVIAVENFEPMVFPFVKLMIYLCSSAGWRMNALRTTAGNIEC